MPDGTVDLAAMVAERVDRRSNTTVRELLHRVFLRWPLFLACTLLVPAVALYMLSILPPTYETSAQVLVKHETADTAYFSGLATARRQGITGQTSAQIMMGMPLIKLVVERNNVTASDIAHSPIRIVMAKVMPIVNAVLDLFLGESGSASDAASDPGTLLAGAFKANVTATTLQKSRPTLVVSEELVEVKFKSPNRDRVAQLTNAIAQTFIDEYFRVAEEEARSAYQYLSEQADKMEKQLEAGASNPETRKWGTRNTSTSPLYSGAASQIAELEIEVARVRSVYARGTPEVRKAQARLSRARQLLTKQEVDDTGKSLLEAFQKKRDQAYMNMELYKQRLAPISVIETAATPGPVSRLRWVLGGAGGLVSGLLLGFVLVMFLSALDARVFSSWQLERAVRAPILASIPRLDTKHHDPSDVEALVLPAASRVLAKVVASLELSGDAKGCQTVVMCSPNSGDGKTMLTLQIAQQLARDGTTRTLVIDADLYGSSMEHSSPKVDDDGNVRGLVDVLSGRAALESVCYSVRHNLDVVPAGRPEGREEVGLFRQTFQQELALARERYDVVVIDTTDLISSLDGAIIASEADHTILIAKSGVTRQNALAHGLSVLDSAGTHPMGVVLNFQQQPIPSFLYRSV